MIAGRPDALRATMLARTTQTNEPARCAVLLPLLAACRSRLPSSKSVRRPASACCPTATATIGGALVLRPPVPTRRLPLHGDGSGTAAAALPRIVWRAGLDLNPLDVMSDEDMAGLAESLDLAGAGGPPQSPRRACRRATRSAARRARRSLDDLAPLMAEAPAEATLVVCTAVLAYVSAIEARLRFVDTVRGSRAVWISNEVPSVFPDIATRASSRCRVAGFSWRSMASQKPGPIRMDSR